MVPRIASEPILLCGSDEASETTEAVVARLDLG
jgi:hypothetical protein